MTKKKENFKKKLIGAARKTDEYLESLRGRKEQLAKDVKQIGREFKKPISTAYEEFESVRQPASRFFQRVGAGVVRGTRPYSITGYSDSQIAPINEYPAEAYPETQMPQYPNVKRWKQPVVRKAVPVWSGRPTRGLANGRRVWAGRRTSGRLPKLWRG